MSIVKFYRNDPNAPKPNTPARLGANAIITCDGKLLREKRRDFQFESAMVTQQSTSNWISSLTLDRGTLHGVTVGNCVVTEEGFLVGIVTEVGLNWCTLLTVLDTDTSLGALVFRTGDVAVAQRGGGHQGAVCDMHAVVHLVAFLEPAENRDGVLHAGFGHIHRLEAALQRSIFLDVFAVFIQGGGADGAQLAAGQGRLEEVGCIHGALAAGTGSHQGVQLVNE